MSGHDNDAFEVTQGLIPAAPGSKVCFESVRARMCVVCVCVSQQESATKDSSLGVLCSAYLLLNGSNLNMLKAPNTQHETETPAMPTHGQKLEVVKSLQMEQLYEPKLSGKGAAVSLL